MYEITVSYEQFFTLSIDMLCVVDYQGNFLQVNPAWTNILGWKKDALLFKPFRNLVHPDDLLRTDAVMLTIINGLTIINFENRYIDIQNKYHWMQWTAAPQTEQRKIYCVVRDITLQKEAELKLMHDNLLLEKKIQERTAELNQLVVTLKHKNFELEQFTHIASHDLQEPLRIISNYLQLLDRRSINLSDKDKDYIAKAVNSCKRIRSFITDLLSLASIDTLNKTYNVSAQYIVQTAISNCKTSIEDSNALIVVNPLPIIIGNVTYFVQVFQNLISNSIKFRKKDIQPTITISAVRQDRYWIITIQDNGIGIAQQYISEVFKPFNRIHLRDEYGGNGIGLSICKRIVEICGGEIWLESEEGIGTIVYLKLLAVVGDGNGESITNRG